MTWVYTNTHNRHQKGKKFKSAIEEKSFATVDPTWRGVATTHPFLKERTQKEDCRTRLLVYWLGGAMSSNRELVCSSPDRRIVGYDQWRVVLAAPMGNSISSQSLVLYNKLGKQLVVSSRPAVDEKSRICPMCGSSPSQGPRSPTRSSKHQQAPREADINEPRYFKLLTRLMAPASSSPSSSSTPDPSPSSILADEDHPGGYDDLPKTAFNTGYYVHFFREERKLGSGGFGSVFLVTHLLDEVLLGQYALKKVAVGNSRVRLTKVLSEVTEMERLTHRNVINYKHSWLEQCKLADFGPSVPCLFILMQYANLGTVADLLWPSSDSTVAMGKGKGKDSLVVYETSTHADEHSTQYLDESEILHIAQGTCRGLFYLHSSGIAHRYDRIVCIFMNISPLSFPYPLIILLFVPRDIKPENIFLCDASAQATDGYHKQNEWSYDVLVGDLGESRPLATGHSHSGNTGTTSYCAPESLLESTKGEEKESATPAEGATDSEDVLRDLWSLGVVVYALCYSQLPFAGDSPADVLSSIREAKGALPIPSESTVPARSQFLTTLIRELLQLEPSNRCDWDRVFALLKLAKADVTAKTQAASGASPLLGSVSGASKTWPPRSGRGAVSILEGEEVGVELHRRASRESEYASPRSNSPLTLVPIDALHLQLEPSAMPTLLLKDHRDDTAATESPPSSGLRQRRKSLGVHRPASTPLHTQKFDKNSSSGGSANEHTGKSIMQASPTHPPKHTHDGSGINGDAKTPSVVARIDSRRPTVSSESSKSGVQSKLDGKWSRSHARQVCVVIGMLCKIVLLCTTCALHPGGPSPLPFYVLLVSACASLLVTHSGGWVLTLEGLGVVSAVMLGLSRCSFCGVVPECGSSFHCDAAVACMPVSEMTRVACMLGLITMTTLAVPRLPLFQDE
jgi:serine/threonine protein kinase